MARGLVCTLSRKRSPSCRAPSTLTPSFRRVPYFALNSRPDAYAPAAQKKPDKVSESLSLRPMATEDDNLLRNTIAHSTEDRFIFHSIAIDDGLSAAYDYGDNGGQ